MPRICHILIVIIMAAGALAFAQEKIEFQTAADFDSASAEDRFLAHDKAGHFIGSAVLTGIGTWLYQRFGSNERKSVVFGVSFALTGGLFKEFRDLCGPGGHFSWKDLVADILGCLFGCAAMIWVSQ